MLPRQWSPLWHRVTCRRTITTQPATFASIKYELQSRPPRIYHDYLVPTHSHLLSLSLTDPAAVSNSHSSQSLQTPVDIDHHHAIPSTKQSLPLPQGHHLVYFPPTHPTASLLPDGTDTDQFPGPPFVRRLWAGGSLTFHDNNNNNTTIPRDERLILDGRRAVCVETIDDVRITGVPPGKEARTGNAPGHGEKIYVDVIRRYAAIPENDIQDKRQQQKGVFDETLQQHAAVVEKRTLVFLTAKTAQEARQDTEKPRRKVFRVPPYTPTYTLVIRPSPALLFRFSALSFNAHAIHLDRQHCREVEGYRELLVHGPFLLVLMCTALREAAQQHHLSAKRDTLPAIRRIDYRNLAPVLVDEEFHVCVRSRTGEEGSKWDVWVVGLEGNLCVKGTATIE